MTQCYLCGSTEFTYRDGHVRDINQLKIHECLHCGLVYLSSFDHINEGFYEESGMLGGEVNIESYRHASRQDDERRYKYLKNVLSTKSVLDFGCGAGGFLSLANQVTQSITGLELDQNIRGHLENVEGIRMFASLDELKGCYDIITMFHVLEHLSDPARILSQLSAHLNPEGRIIVEIPNSDDALLTLYGNEAFSRFTYWSCHLYLFNPSTLSLVADKAGLKVDFIQQVQRYPLSNHLYWLANGKPGGHEHWGYLDSYELHAAYEKQLASIGKCDTLLACFSK